MAWFTYPAGVLLQLLTCYILLIHIQNIFSTPAFTLAYTAPFTVHSCLSLSVLPPSDVDQDTRLFLRIMEWFGLEGTFKGYLVQAPCSEQGHLHLDQVALEPLST